MRIPANKIFDIYKDPDWVKDSGVCLLELNMFEEAKRSGLQVTMMWLEVWGRHYRGLSLRNKTSLELYLGEGV